MSKHRSGLVELVQDAVIEVGTQMQSSSTGWDVWALTAICFA